MTAIEEGRLTFTVSGDYAALKFDSWSHFRQWADPQKGRKGVDIAAAGISTAWLVEVKDLRIQDQAPKAKNSSNLAETVAKKVSDSLEGLEFLAGQNEPFAMRVQSAKTKRVVLHLEPPAHGSRLFPTRPQMANIQQRLRSLVRRVDPKAFVLEVSTTATAGVPWTVQ